MLNAQHISAEGRLKLSIDCLRVVVWVHAKCPEETCRLLSWVVHVKHTI